MLLALVYPIVLGLDRIETASLLRSNGTLQYLTGLPDFPDPQTIRRFLLNAPVDLRTQLHRAKDRLLQRFIHVPEHRLRLLLDLDSTVVTSFGHQEGAEVGYNPRYRGKRSYDPLLCIEANSSFLWDVELRRGDAGTWAGSDRSERLRASEQRYRELKQQLEDVGFVCVGSLQTRYLPCGNPSCRCHQDPAKRHGPYHYWTRKVKGRTVTILLKQEQVPLFPEWIQNHRRLEDLVQEMRRISAQLLSAEGDSLRS